ncbi:hypothetical protein [Terasakiella sp. SH-1]|uniref:hypothetical protein n=1 Tax=Terasakiella sp. SH-1 TaxID=2560057 RepID=UPI0010737401|nr:hypothetical protein [Terasakiella sp. SH-1]
MHHEDYASSITDKYPYSFHLANAPKFPKKSKAQMDKMWEQVAENKKAKTTQEALQGLMKNPLYQKKDQAYVKHVQDEFKRAYPGNVQYDETGKMVEVESAIGPHEVRAFAQPQQVSAGHPTHYSEQTEKAIREKRYSGNEEEAFADMQNILMKDPDGFKNFSQEDRAAYQAYQKKRRQHWRPDRKPHEEEQVKRNAIEASRDAGAGTHIVPEAKREFWNNAADAAHGAVVVSGGGQDQLDAIEKTRQRKMEENPLPDIYKGRTPGRFADDVANLNPLQGALSAAGKAAKDLEKMGISKDGQQIGGAIMGLVGLGGTGGAKLGAGEIKDYLAKRFGKNWSKRLTPKDVEVLNDQLIGQGLQVGTSASIRAAGKDDTFEN